MEKTRIWLVDDHLLHVPTQADIFADVDPENPDALLIPWNGRTKEPPQAGQHQAVRSLGHDHDADWEVVADWRGVDIWTPDGQKHLISEVGIAPPDGALFEDPGPTPEQLKVREVAQIKAQLQAIDGKTPRAARDAILSGDKTRVQDLETQAEGLRQRLAQLA